MHKRIVQYLFAFIAVGVVAGIGLWIWYVQPLPTETMLTDEDIQQAQMRVGINSSGTKQTNVVERLDPSRRVRLAIGSLGMSAADNDKLGDLLTVELSKEKNLELVDRQSIQKILREANLSLSGVVRAKDAIRVGKLLRADWFLLGSRYAVSGAQAIVVRVVDTRSGIMRDVGVFPIKNELDATRSLAGFVRQSRNTASGGRPRVYLGLGGICGRWPERSAS